MRKIVGILLCAAATQSLAQSPTFQDGFESGLGNWHPKLGKIEVIDVGCIEGNKCVRIQRENGRGYTFIARAFRVPSRGTLRFEAKMRADNVVPGAQNFHRAKFVAVVIEGQTEVDWPNADFEGSLNEWITRTVVVPDLDPSVTVELRVGLQNAKGTVYLDDVRVFFTPSAK